MTEDTQFCPDCGTEVGGQGSNDDHAGLKVLGLLLSFISIFFLPVILGPAAMFCGYRLSKHGEDQWGRGLMLAGGFCMTVGMLLALAILL